MIGEDPQGIPNNLMPYVAQVRPPQPLGGHREGTQGAGAVPLCRWQWDAGNS